MKDNTIERLKEKVFIVDEINRTYSEDDEVIDTLWGLIRRKVLVPVICEDMYEYVNPDTNEHQILHSYIVEKVINRFSKKGMRLEMTERELENVVNKGYFGTSILERKAHEAIPEAIYKSVVDRDNNIYNNIGLKEEVKQFLKTCHFPLIVTTSCFPIIEKELGAEYHSYWNQLGIKNDKPLPEYCVYHIFGEAKPENPDWGYNEKQMLRFVRSTNSTEYALANLSSEIGTNNSNKTLLIIGNDTPNWLFRFILSPIYGGDVYDAKKGYYMSDKSRETDIGLNYFLDDIHYEKESQLINVLSKITNSYKEIEPTGCISHGKKHDLFISYRSKDKEKLEKLLQRLQEEHEGIKLNIWYDKDPVNGIKDGSYWEKIIKELKDSAYFLPFITKNYIKETFEKDDRQDVMDKFGIKSIAMTPEEAWKIADALSPIQTELLLANQWLSLNPQKVYCIPIIAANETYMGKPITAEIIEEWGATETLPRNLFQGQQMFLFDEESPENFSLDWKRYKTTITNL